MIVSVPKPEHQGTKIPTSGAGSDVEILLHRQGGKNLAFLRHPTDAGEGAAVGLPALRAVADQNLDLHACLSEAKPR